MYNTEDKHMYNTEDKHMYNTGDKHMYNAGDKHMYNAGGKHTCTLAKVLCSNVVGLTSLLAVRVMAWLAEGKG